MTRKMGAGVSTLGMIMSTKGDTCVEFVVWFFSVEEVILYWRNYFLFSHI